MHFFSFRVALYGEFLPVKQRARCVILLDVSLHINMCEMKCIRINM